jgi:hypothetical protein
MTVPVDPAPPAEEHHRTRDQAIDDYLRSAASEAPIVDGIQEDELLLRARQGDETAFKLLVESYTVLAGHLALKLLPASGRLSAIDAVQEAIVALVRLVRDQRVSRPAVVLADAIQAAISRAEARLR